MNLKVDNKGEVLSYVELDNDEDIEQIEDSEVMEVIVPNTLKNNYNIIYICLLGIYITKKLLW